MVFLKELSNMFWGLTLDGGRRYSQEVDRPFHVSMAALESSFDVPAEKRGSVQVMIQKQAGSPFLLCTLGHGVHLQQHLDLYFSSGESVEFFLIGKGVVHLTGSMREEEDDFADDDGENEHDSESDTPPVLGGIDWDDSDDEDADWSPEQEQVGSKRKSTPMTDSKSKKLKITELIEDEDGDMIDSYCIDDETLEFVGEEESAEDEEDEDEDYDSFTEELFSAYQSAKKVSTSSPETPDLKRKKKKDKSPKVNESQQAEAGSAGDAANGDATEKKKKKKKKKKKHAKEDGGDQQQQNCAERPPESPTPKSTPPVGKKRTVAGGTSVEDIKIGHGPEAKPGKTVSVYYAGILGKNNKRFDSCLKGKPFRFRMGRGEVIKGWDTGLIGMKVGGKRKITVPPSQGYGNARQGPIPPGSTLVFEVELKAVN